MTTNRIPIARERRGRLTADQEQALWLGPLSGAFESEDDCRVAWERHRASMLHMFGQDGRRPVAWWRFDAPEGLEFDYDTERSCLYEHNLLEPNEREELVAYWRSEFDKAREPGFALCVSSGPNGWLTGAAAKRAHYAWADVPQSLIEKWTNERRAIA